VVILDETDVDTEMMQTILFSFTNIGKPLRKVVFVGLSDKMKRTIRRKKSILNFAVACIDDLEKAKEWAL